MGSSKSSSTKVTVGYKYYAGMHLVICQEPIDAITGIKFGDDMAWEGSVNSGTININKPDLFGGKKSGGGVQGKIDVLNGAKTQGVNAYLQKHLGASIPAWRGVVSLVFNQLYLCANSPYVKAVAVRVQSFRGAKVGSGCNAATIILAVLQGERFGVNLADDQIDLASFTAARTKLAAEGFGLSFVWTNSSTAENFIQNICDHIDAFVYHDIKTGKIKLKLVRDDYDKENLPVVNEDNILEMVSYSRKTAAELTNCMTVTYTDVDDNTQSVTEHNTALRAQQGGQTVAETKTYDGITDGSLARVVALRELRTASAMLSVAQVVVNRETGYSLSLGDVVALSWTRRRVENEIMRVTAIDYGNVKDNRVTLDLQQDVYAVGLSIGAETPETGWVNPIHDPVPSPARKIFERPYLFWSRLFGDSEAAWAELGDLQGSHVVCAQKPTGDTAEFDLYFAANAADDYLLETSGATYTPNCVIGAALGKEVSSTVAYSGLDTFAEIDAGTICAIDDELCEVTAINAETGVMTLKRGILDTVPVAHAQGAACWFFEDWAEFGLSLFPLTQAVRYKCLPTTGLGTLPLSDAPVDSLTFNARQIRPYVPGNYKFNGVLWPEEITGLITVDWATRNRKLQTYDTIVSQTAVNVIAENGTTYTLKFYDENGALKRTVSGLEATSYTWETEVEDCGLVDRLNAQVRVTLTAVRNDGAMAWESWQMQDHTVIRTDTTPPEPPETEGGLG